MSSRPFRRTLTGLVVTLNLAMLPGLAAAQAFTLWVTETPAGGTLQFNSQLKGGVRSYTFDGLGYTPANYSLGPLVAAAGLNDPSDVVLQPSTGDLLISNRGFNTGPGSVSRVTLTGLVPNAPTVALANIDTGPHQAAATAAGDLVVSSLNSGGKLYPGVTTPSTVSFASGAQRGAVTGGNLLYSTNGASTLQVYDLNTGAQVGGNFNVAGSSLLHYGALFGGSLYLADIGANPNGAGGGVYKVTLDGNGNPTGSSKVANVDGAISVAFSAAGDEMFVAGHFSGILTGFAVSGGIVSASPNLTIDGGTLASWNGAHVQYGGLAVTAVPEPGTYTMLMAGLGSLAFLLRRRRPR